MTSELKFLHYANCYSCYQHHFSDLTVFHGQNNHLNLKIAEKNSEIVEQKVNCHAKVLAQLLWVRCVLDRVIHIFFEIP